MRYEVREARGGSPASELGSLRPRLRQGYGVAGPFSTAAHSRPRGTSYFIPHTSYFYLCTEAGMV